MRWWKWTAMVLLSLVIVLGIAGFRRAMAPSASSGTLQDVVLLLGRAGINFVQDEER